MIVCSREDLLLNACHFVVSYSFQGLRVSFPSQDSIVLENPTLLGLVDLYTGVDLIVFIPVQNFADFCLLMLLMRHDCYLNGLTGS